MTKQYIMKLFEQLEGLGSTTHPRLTLYAIIVAGNGTSVSMGSHEGFGVGRIQGSSIWFVQKDTDLIDEKSSPEQDPIIRMGAGQPKLPIRDGYMPTPTLLVAH